MTGKMFMPWKYFYRRRGVVARFVCYLVVSLLVFPVIEVDAQDEITVVYPIVREPFSNVYRDFISGIKKGYNGSVREYPINGSIPLSLVRPGSDEHRKKAIIALGNKSYTALSAMDVKLPVYAALTRATDGNALYGGVLLEAGAESYLSTLLEIVPQVRHVHVVYNPVRHKPLVNEAVDYLEKRSISLNHMPANDIRESARSFREIVKKAKKGDAIWLMSDSELVDGSLLGLVLDAAWEKKLIVFSANPVFVKRGALFAIYPDNIGVGYRLGQMAQAPVDGVRVRKMLEPLRDINVAFNERTGNHIGVSLSPAAREKIELFLPEM